jgi:single-stranded DNA-specific DHH superfamily exonuclease
MLGPRINAGGRIGRADLGVRLLLEEDPTEAARIAAELERLNIERRQIEIATVAQADAEAMAALGLEEKGAVVVTAGEGWHAGVVGLVGARCAKACCSREVGTPWRPASRCAKTRWPRSAPISRRRWPRRSKRRGASARC